MTVTYIQSRTLTPALVFAKVINLSGKFLGMRTCVCSLVKMATANPVDDRLTRKNDNTNLSNPFQPMKNQLSISKISTQMSSDFTSVISCTHTGLSLESNMMSQGSLQNAMPVQSLGTEPIYSIGNNQSRNGNAMLPEKVASDSMPNLSHTVFKGGCAGTSTSGSRVINISGNPPQVQSGGLQTGTSLGQSLGVIGIQNQQQTILNTANVSSHKQLISNAQSLRQQVVTNSDIKSNVLINQVNSHSPQCLVKDEVKIDRSSLPHGSIRILNPMSQVNTNVNAPGNHQNVICTPTCSSTSVVVANAVSNTQTVTVMRPTISAAVALQNSGHVNPSRVVNSLAKPIMQRNPVVAPVRIAPNQQPVLRPPGVSMYCCHRLIMF